MISIKKLFLLASLAISSILYANEPSVYGAGNIDSETPYGLTQTERTVLENKKTIQMLYNKINEQQRKVDGLGTIIEGQNKEIVELAKENDLEVLAWTVDDPVKAKKLVEMGVSGITTNRPQWLKEEMAKL